MNDGSFPAGGQGVLRLGWLYLAVLGLALPAAPIAAQSVRPVLEDRPSSNSAKPSPERPQPVLAEFPLAPAPLPAAAPQAIPASVTAEIPPAELVELKAVVKKAPTGRQAVFVATEPVCKHRSVDRPLSQVRAELLPVSGPTPEDLASEVFGSLQGAEMLADQPRPWAASAFYWQASWLAHYPLCFEQKMLERYGYSYCPLLQPAISGAHFFATIPIIPYKKGLDPHHRFIYELGFARAAGDSPFLRPRIPLNARGAAYEAGAVTGLIFFIP
ncbi:MAG: hypothetical protein U0836_02310 [Pirellulales bacterium]